MHAALIPAFALALVSGARAESFEFGGLARAYFIEAGRRAAAVPEEARRDRVPGFRRNGDNREFLRNRRSDVPAGSAEIEKGKPKMNPRRGRQSSPKALLSPRLRIV